jgi:ABC-type uncharacterized transport system permease subunit
LNYDPAFVNFALLSFSGAAVLYLLAFQNAPRTAPQAAGGATGRGQVSRWQKSVGQLAFGMFVAATLTLTAALISLASRAPLPGLSTMAGLLLTLVVSWLSILGHLGFKLKMIGAFVAPLATLILLVQSFVAPTSLVQPLQTADLGDLGSLMGLHIIMAVFGQSFAIIACAVSIFYLWQQSLLKKKLINQLPRSLPAIDKLDSLLTLTLWVGFVFITLSLLSGAIYTQLFATRGGDETAAGLRGGFGLELKVAWAITIWLWYLATLLARNIFNRPGKRIAQMSLGGFVLLAMTYFGMGFFKPWGA